MALSKGQKRRIRREAEDNGIAAGVVIFWSAVGVVLVSVLGFVGFQEHWWYAQTAADNRAKVIQHGYENQTTLQDEITADIGQIHKLTLEADNGGNASDIATTQHDILVQLCSDASKLDAPLQGDQGTFVTSHCADGAPK